MMDCKISKLSDLCQLAECHMKAFPDSLSTKLGKKFCIKMLEWYLVSERGIIFHIEDRGKIIGYCSGIKKLKEGLPGSVSSISQFAFKSFVFAFIKRPYLIFHPENIKKRKTILKNIKIKLRLTKPINTNSNIPISDFKPHWGLVGIGIAPDFQGLGYGSLMLKKFEELAKESNISFIQLSVKTVNKNAIKSYTKNVWETIRIVQDSLIMRKKI